MSTAKLRAFCLRVVRFMSTITMDPHLYFQTRFTAEFERLDSVEDLRAGARDLIEWVDQAGLSDRERRALDEALAADGLPAFSQVCDDAGMG